MLARFLFKVSVQKKTARRFRPGGFGICSNYVFLRTTLFRRLPKPGKEAKKNIERGREIYIHFPNIINSWPLCKRAFIIFNKHADGVASTPLKFQELYRALRYIVVLLSTWTGKQTMQATQAPNIFEWYQNIHERLALPSPDYTGLTPTASAVRNLAQDMRICLQSMLHNRIFRPVAEDEPACRVASDRAITQLNTILQPARRSAYLNSVSDTRYLPEERLWGLDVTSLCLTLDPRNSLAWSMTYQLLPDAQTTALVQSPKGPIKINRERAQASTMRAICSSGGRTLDSLQTGQECVKTVEELVRLSTPHQKVDQELIDFIQQEFGTTGIIPPQENPMDEEELLRFIQTELGENSAQSKLIEYRP